MMADFFTYISFNCKSNETKCHHTFLGCVSYRHCMGINMGRTLSIQNSSFVWKKNVIWIFRRKKQLFSSLKLNIFASAQNRLFMYLKMVQTYRTDPESGGCVLSALHIRFYFTWHIKNVYVIDYTLYAPVVLSKVLLSHLGLKTFWISFPKYCNVAIFLFFWKLCSDGSPPLGGTEVEQVSCWRSNRKIYQLGRHRAEPPGLTQPSDKDSIWHTPMPPFNFPQRFGSKERCPLCKNIKCRPPTHLPSFSSQLDKVERTAASRR